MAAVIVHQEKERYVIRDYIHVTNGTRIACDAARTVGYLLIVA